MRATIVPMLAIITSTFAASSMSSISASASTHTPACPNVAIVNIVAYEFPYCLASQSAIGQHLFLSRPHNTKFAAVREVNSTGPYGSGCADVDSTVGVAHSFFYTADGANLQACELLTYDAKGCQGGMTRHPTSVGFSECFTKAAKFVQPLIASAEILCASP